MVIKNSKYLLMTYSIVVLDMDETLGYFTELGIFCDILSQYNEISEQHFFEIIDLFNEFLRPHIFKILSYIKNKKQNGICNKVMMYTNNQGPKEWSLKISKYFERKLNYKLFDQIILAFKVRGKIVEPLRTTNNKTINDLFRCTKIPKHTRICFIDDKCYPLMKSDNVYYINMKPYKYSLSYDEMINRYYNKFSNNINVSKNIFKTFIKKNMLRYNYHVFNKSNEEQEIDIIVSKQILVHISEFFKKVEQTQTQTNTYTKLKTLKKKRKINSNSKKTMKNK